MREKKVLIFLLAAVLAVMFVSPVHAGWNLKLEKDVPYADLTGVPGTVVFDIYDSAAAVTPIASQTFASGNWSADYSFSNYATANIANMVRFKADFTNTSALVWGMDLWIEMAVDGTYHGVRQKVMQSAWAVFSEEAGYAANAGDADTVDGVQASALEESAEIDADIAAHAGNASAHHTKTTSFTELTGSATDAQIPNTITINYAAGAGNADTVDGAHASALEESAEIDADIAAHAGNASAHHTKTTSFTELTGAATDAQIPNTITINYAASAGNSDTVDGLHASSFLTSETDPQVGTNTTSRVPRWNGSALVTGTIYDNGTNIGIGTTVPAEKLHVMGGDFGVGTSTLFTNGSVVGIGTATPLDNVGGTSRGALRIESGANPAVILNQTSSSPAEWEIFPSAADGAILFNNQGGGGYVASIETDGKMGVGTISPGAQLEVAGDILATSSTSGLSGIKAVHTAINNDTPAVLGEHDISDYYGIGVKGVGGYRGVEGRVDATGTGSYYGVYGYVNSTGTNGYTYGMYAAAHGSSTNNRGVYATSSGDGYGGYFYQSGPQGTGVYTYAAGVSGVGLLARGGSGGYAGVFEGNVLIKSRSTGATIMELGEGLDYAEGFDVSDDNIIPGTVLSIDPINAGQLTMSRDAYDSKVAGIVAGANNLGSGVRLGAGQFDNDVALAGRVYCNVDASYGAITPGDLLTTSPTPGHAMLVSDHTKAQGAILGKAMQGLRKGEKGQILVLVTLQ